MNQIIATHSGTFHADEIFAIALIKVFVNNKVAVHRTRNQSIIDEADFAIDVGGLYLVDAQRFDHHQFKESHYCYGLSSAGLVFKYLKNNGMDSIHIDALKKLVAEIDEHDIGSHKHNVNHFTGIISSFNHKDVDSEYQESKFNDALDFTIGHIKRLTSYAEHKNSQRIRLESLKPDSNGFMFSKEYIDDWKIKAFKESAKAFICYNKSDDDYSVLIPPINLDSYDSLYELVPTGTSNEIFVHQQGFIGKYKASDDSKILFSIKTKVTNQIDTYELHVD